MSELGSYADKLYTQYKDELSNYLSNRLERIKEIDKEHYQERRDKAITNADKFFNDKYNELKSGHNMIDVYHGTPQPWDTPVFNPDKLLTGEGYNVFGKGMYTAYDPDIAYTRYAERYDLNDTLSGKYIDPTLYSTKLDTFKYYDTTLPYSEQSPVVQKAIDNIVAKGVLENSLESQAKNILQLQGIENPTDIQIKEYIKSKPETLSNKLYIENVDDIPLQSNRLKGELSYNRLMDELAKEGIEGITRVGKTDGRIFVTHPSFLKTVQPALDDVSVLRQSFGISPEYLDAYVNPEFLNQNLDFKTLLNKEIPIPTIAKNIIKNPVVKGATKTIGAAAVPLDIYFAYEDVGKPLAKTISYEKQLRQPTEFASLSPRDQEYIKSKVPNMNTQTEFKTTPKDILNQYKAEQEQAWNILGDYFNLLKPSLKPLTLEERNKLYR